LQDLRVDVAVFWPHFLDCGELGALPRLSDAHAAFAPRLFALLKSSVVEFAAAAQDKRQRSFLLRRRLQFIFEGFAHRLRLHATLFCLIGRKPARGIGTFIPRSSRGVFCPPSVILCYVVWKLVYSVLHSMRFTGILKPS